MPGHNFSLLIERLVMWLGVGVEKMRLGFEVKKPTMPNFILMEVPAGQRQDGFNPEAGKISITELDKKQAVEYAQLMFDTFVEHWREKKANAQST